MRALLTISLIEIREQFARFLVSILAVILGVTFLSATLTLRTAMDSSFNSALQSADSPDITLSAKNADGAINLNKSLVDEVKKVPGVSAVFIDEPYMGSYLLTKDDVPIGPFNMPAFLFPQHIGHPARELTEGRYAETSKEIVIAADTAKSYDIKVGQELHLYDKGEVTPITVVGIIGPETGRAGGGTAIGTIEDSFFTTISGQGDEVAKFNIWLDPGINPDDMTSKIAAVVPDGHGVAKTKQQTHDEMKKQLDTVLGFVGTFLLVFVFVAVFVGSFIISNTFQMSVRQRLKQFAMLRAIGTGANQVFTIVIVQAAIVGLIGSIVGLALGIGAVHLISFIFERTNMNFITEVPLDMTALVASLVIGIGTTVVASVMPARTAAVTPPVEVLRESAGSSQPLFGKRFISGVITMFLAVGAFVLNQYVMETPNIAITGVVAFFVLVGVLLLTPALSVPVTHLLTFALRTPVGRLARGNVLRNPQRTANTAGALVIGLALVAAGGTLAASLDHSIEQMTDEIPAQGVLQANQMNPIPSKTVEKVAALPFVTEVGSVYAVPGTIKGGNDPQAAQMEKMKQENPELAAQMEANPVGGAVVFSQVLADSKADLVYTIKVLEGDIANLDNGQAAGLIPKYPDDMTQAELDKAKENQRWHMGDKVTLDTVEHKHFETTIGVMLEVPPMVYGQGVFFPSSAKDQILTGDAGPNTVGLMFDDKKTPDEYVKEVDEAIGKHFGFAVYDKEQLQSSNKATISMILNILYGLLGLSVVTAIFGVVNTLVMSVLERVRELGLLRAIGMSNLKIALVIMIEGVVISMIGTVLGVSVGLGLGNLIINALGSSGISTFVAPYGLIAQIAVAMFVIGLLASLIPTWRALRRPVLEAIAVD